MMNSFSSYHGNISTSLTIALAFSISLGRTFGDLVSDEISGQKKLESAFDNKFHSQKGRRLLDSFESTELADEGSIIAMQFGADKHSGSDKLKLVLDGTLQLVNCSIRPNSFVEEGTSYENIHCSFCDISPEIWKTQKQFPSLYPHFGNIIGASDHCNDHQYSFSLIDIIKAIDSYEDANSAQNAQVHNMECGAFVFHQGRSGSSVFMNAINLADSKGLVFSEHPALEAVLNACDKAKNLYGENDCQLDKQVNAMRDIVKVISRTKNYETTAYFKFHPSTAGNINVAAAAYPECKRIFIYREANTLLAKNTERKKNSCVKMRNHPNQALKEYVTEKGVDLQEMTDEMVCSAYLASLLRAASNQHSMSPPGISIMISYDDDINMNSDAVISILSDFLNIDVENPATRQIIHDEFKLRATGRKRGEPWSGEDVYITEKVLEASLLFLEEETISQP